MDGDVYEDHDPDTDILLSLMLNGARNSTRLRCTKTDIFETRRRIFIVP